MANDASFFFLHNIQCQGFCSVGVTTVVTDTITNTGSSAVSLRLDSNITAGHLGLVQNAKTASAGIFQFDVSQTTGGTGHQLYQALGQISSSGASISTSDGSTFHDLAGYQDASQIGLDWAETDLSLLLDTLAPMQTTTVTYTSVTYLNSYGICSNYDLCDGVQVAFGDPRNKGGIIGLSKIFSPGDALNPQPVGWVLNRGFNMARVRMDIVNLSAVPEPGSWAMMMVGFGLIGTAMRRRGATKTAFG
ncbi:MAG: PEP-CTERM sorting domain-containing protein [Asticcacaulis sp.]|nr:PEP-CTERM sorting domain-containing protein [Asticcacaulis sp.]